MASSLSSMLREPVSDYTLTTKYRAHIETLRLVMRNDANTDIIPVVAETAYLYRGDLTGLLTYLGVKKEDHYLVMRVNNLRSIHDVDTSLTEIYIPSKQLRDRLKKVFKQSLT